jgi:hypothetical protein
MEQTVPVTPETSAQRQAREQRRVLFDGVAVRYDATRPGCPAEVVDDVIANAAAGPDARNTSAPAAVRTITVGVVSTPRPSARSGSDSTTCSVNPALGTKRTA